MEQLGYDVNTKAKLAIAPQNVTLTLNQAMLVVTHIFDMTGAMQTSALSTGSTQTISVSDLVTVLEISGQ